MGEEVGLVAGDEDDASACRHQRHSLQCKAPLGIAVEALRVPGVGAQLEADRRVEDQGVQSPEASRDGVDHRRGLSLIGDVGAQRRGVPACAADGVGHGFRTLGLLAVVHDDVGVGAGELLGDLGTDAPRSAGDQDDPCRCVMHVGFLPSRPCVRFGTLTVHNF